MKLKLNALKTLSNSRLSFFDVDAWYVYLTVEPKHKYVYNAVSRDRTITHINSTGVWREWTTAGRGEGKQIGFRK